MIVIIDYGMSNLRSIYYKLSSSGIESVISSEPEKISMADKIILPGVGHFKSGMENLHRRNLVDVLKQKVSNDKTPIFGICLGMQLFSNHSEEGDCNGLGFIDSQVVKFNIPKDLNYKIPHVGWNVANFVAESKILEGIPRNQEFYFTHSYHLECNEEMVLSKTSYGIDFVSAVKSKNVIGTQFHPEKSHLKGFQLLLNFCKN